jgi:hypothetical protein
MKRTASNFQSLKQQRPMREMTDWISGISVTSPSGNWVAEVNTNRSDFAENYGTTATVFFAADENGDQRIFVADHVLAAGEQEVSRLLIAEANRRWTWGIGRLPTGLECDLLEASSVLCALYGPKSKLVWTTE